MHKKRVLYIGTPIFNYHTQIIAEFEAQGYSVDFYNDRPSESSLIKGLIKIKRSLLSSLILKYFNQILSETQSWTYDLVFIVNCKVFTPCMIQQLKNSQQSARFVLYMWDSFALYPESRKLISLFDKAYSFDSYDCDKIEELTLLPLFYCKAYEEVGRDSNTVDREYDIVSVCTAHSNRYKMMRNLFPELEEKGIRIFSYMYLNRMQYWYNKMFVEEFKSATRDQFKFEPLSEKDNIAVLRKSNSVFDMQHNKQSGLTMRTIETLGAKRKLITSNAAIMDYDFYNENNIFVLNGSNWAKIEGFIKNAFDPIDVDVYTKYSIHNWINTIINEAENEYIAHR